MECRVTTNFMSFRTLGDNSGEMAVLSNSCVQMKTMSCAGWTTSRRTGLLAKARMSQSRFVECAACCLIRLFLFFLGLFKVHVVCNLPSETGDSVSDPIVHVLLCLQTWS